MMLWDSQIQGDRWDAEADVIVAGYGFAGAVAAINAHDAGARVLLLEKARHYGGNSIVSAGGVILAEDQAKAFEYLTRINAGNTPGEVVQRMARGMVELGGYLRELAHAVGAEIEFGEVGKGATYPLPGGETLFFARASASNPIADYPWAKGLRGGGRLFKIVADNVERRGIEVWCSAPARRLLRDRRGAIVGLLVEREGKQVAIKARRGVVLATGGFANNEQLRRQFLRVLPSYPVCSLANTGDGVLMAQEVGAALWHMWHFHGSYGFKFPEFPFAFRTCLRGQRSSTTKVPWILVDKLGRRFMNEYPRAAQDTGARDLDHFDAERVDHPRIPCYLIFDDDARRLGPIADVTINDERYSYEWSEDNLAEVEMGWILQAGSIRDLATCLRIDPDVLSDTVRRWNEQCAEGSDSEYGRLPGSMCPISTPPFYAVAAWPVVTNTQGGPVHDAEQRVLDPFGRPIPRLYAAGELGSIYGHLYQLSGNISECFIGGRLAGLNAAAQQPWDTR